MARKERSGGNPRPSLADRIKNHPVYVIGGVFVTLAGLAFAILAGVSNGGGDSNASTPKAQGAPPLAIASEYPWTSGCPGYGMVAMPPGAGRIGDFHAATDIRASMVASNPGAGSWAVGALYMDLSPTGTRPVEVVDIKPHILRRDLGSPAWIYQPSAGCGPILPDRIFLFNLDQPKWTDTGVDMNTGGGPPQSDTPTSPLGPNFTIAPGTHARVRVKSVSCHGNYEWNLDVVYAVPGSSALQHLVVGPFNSYGLANNTTLYEGVVDKSGVVSVLRQHVISGPPQILCASGTNRPSASRPPSATPQALEPLLGQPWGTYQEGFGTVAPKRVFNGGDPSGAFAITWDTWGGATATGHGTALWVGPHDQVASGHLEAASFKAYDLGMCKGKKVYLHLAVWFPQHGQTFDPQTNGETSYTLCPAN